MATAEYRRVFVIGKSVEGNREMKVVEVGEDTDLPATAEFYYTDVFTQFPYQTEDVEM